MKNSDAQEVEKLNPIGNRYLQSGKMKAIGLTQKPEISHVSGSIQMLEVPVPRPAIGEIAIRLSASAMHVDEIYAAQGTALGRFFAPKKPSVDSPCLLGSSVSGVVVDTGDSVDQFSVGDEVIVIPNEMGETASWAEYRCVPITYVMHKPGQLSHIEAAALTMASCVAWAAVQNGQVEAGSRCVVVGASGAVGSLAVQLLKSLGCYITAVCSADNEGLVRSLGADHVIDYTQHAFGKYLRHAGELQDAVFDFVGGRDVEENALMVLKQKGRFITVVGPEKYIGEEKLSLWEFSKLASYIARRMFLSLFFGARYIFSGTLPRNCIDGALQRALEYDIRMPIDAVIPFDRHAIADSIERLQSHRTKGRIVIDFNKANS